MVFPSCYSAKQCSLSRAELLFTADITQLEPAEDTLVLKRWLICRDSLGKLEMTLFRSILTRSLVISGLTIRLTVPNLFCSSFFQNILILSESVIKSDGRVLSTDQQNLLLVEIFSFLIICTLLFLCCLPLSHYRFISAFFS